MRTQITAHRGATQVAPESTLPAFEHALALGVDAIEFDIHQTADGAVIIHHDYFTGRMNDGGGEYIGDVTLDFLKGLDAGSWFDPAFAGTRIPTLAEALAMGQGRVRFEIEIKTPRVEFVHDVIEQVEQAEMVHAVELTTQHVPLLPHIRQRNPALRVGMFFAPLPEWMSRAVGQQHVIDWMRLSDAQVAHLPLALLDAAFLERLRDEGFRAAAHLNDEPDIVQALKLGVDQISSDFPDRALSLREALATSPSEGSL